MAEMNQARKHGNDEQIQALAAYLSDAIARAGLDEDRLVERTKIPEGTFSVLLGRPDDSVILPRVYVRAHLKVLAKEVDIDTDETMSLFDAAYPFPEDEAPVATERPVTTANLAVAAGLGGAGILAVILAALG